MEGAASNGDSTNASISADGRYVAFQSHASNIVANDTNASDDIFVRDLQLGVTGRVSVDSNGTEGNGYSGLPAISPDGRYVAFYSFASNLVLGDSNGISDAFVRDRQSGTTERVSIDSNGVQQNLASMISTPPAISADGRYVVFVSLATNLVPGTPNNWYDVFVRDRQMGLTLQVSVDSAGIPANSTSNYPSISADGRYVAFMSDANNLVIGDTNGLTDVFLHDLQTGITERVSVDSNGLQGNRYSYFSSISADGRFVAFSSVASNLVAMDSNSTFDIFVRDRQIGSTARVSLSSIGGQGNDESGAYGAPRISPDGRYVAFDSRAWNLVPGPSDVWIDVFVRDRDNNTTEQESVDPNGMHSNNDSDSSLLNQSPSISNDGRYVAFSSQATNLVPGGTTGREIFVRDRNAAGFLTLCDPGVAGVLACPCSNAPSGTGRGCNNSAATGGAILAASGISYLATDSLVFTTSGEKPTATSIVMQGDALAVNGLVFGQGVRCVGGTLKRLYTKNASAGSITAPDFGAGDPSVSARSATLGDVIQAGQSRWYLVYYRDPIVLGGCPASSTFNATQTGRVDWSL